MKAEPSRLIPLKPTENVELFIVLLSWCFLENNQFGFCGADTNMSAIHGPIPIFPKFLNHVFCFVIKNIVYSMLHRFFKNFKKWDL